MLRRFCLLYQSVACADRPHNPNQRTIQHLSLLGFTTQFSYTSEYIVKSILQHIEMSQKYNFHNSGNSHYHSISTPPPPPPRDKTASSPRGAAWRNRRGGKHITRLPRQPNIRSLWPNTSCIFPPHCNPQV